MQSIYCQTYLHQRVQAYHNDDGYVLSISLRVPYSRHDSQNNRPLHNRIIDVMTRHRYLPTMILTDKGSQFRSDVVNQIAQTLDIRISHASTKHAQTIGILERTHASLKTPFFTKNIDGRTMFNVASISNWVLNQNGRKKTTQNSRTNYRNR